MRRRHTFSALAAAAAFGAVAMAAQMLLLRRFLWSFEAVETGVSLFFASWLLWTGLGAAAAATRAGRRLTAGAAPALWLLVAACAGLYFTQYELLATMRVWLGVPAYERFPLPQLAAGCLLANAPLCFVAGFVVPAVCRRLAQLGEPASRAFAWESLGAALGGLCVTALLVRGFSPDPRDEAEWQRYFPGAAERPARFETGAGTTFTGTHGGTFYALAPGGVSEVLPEGDRAAELAALVLSQRPYAKEALLLGRVPLAAGVALARFRPDLPVTWCPCDAAYGSRVVERARAAGLVPTNVCAAGATPQALLAAAGDGAFDAVVVAPPPATELAGAAWRQASFARAVRRVTRRTGVALFELDCDSAAVTPEKAALLSASVTGVRVAWPEGGAAAAGAGGWWIAAQVPRLAYGAEDAAARFARLKRADFSPEAVRLLYDEPRAARLAEACPALNPAEPVRLPEACSPEEILAAGLCDAWRQASPARTPGAWLERVREAGAARLAGLLLVALWMAPVALGGERHARRRLVGAWVAACGALGLAATLSVLYRLQAAFGNLYLLAGAGSCLYLAGLFCGNRLAAAAAARVRGREWLALAAVVVSAAALAAAALGAVYAAACAATALGLICLCFGVGCAAGAAVPVGLEAAGEEADEVAPVFLCADAAGAATAGLAFAALVPLAGLSQAVGCFAALACGVALCVLGGSGHARLTAGLALLAALTALGGRVNALREWGARRQGEAEYAQPAERRAASTNDLPGIPRRLDLPRIGEQLRSGQLATNAAAYWE